MLPYHLNPSQGQTGLQATLTPLARCGDGFSSTRMKDPWTTLASPSWAIESPTLLTQYLDIGLVILTLCPGLTSTVNPDL